MSYASIAIAPPLLARVSTGDPGSDDEQTHTAPHQQ
jgi:hypothetical protein